jgi:hypothetical protein
MKGHEFKLVTIVFAFVLFCTWGSKTLAITPQNGDNTTQERTSTISKAQLLVFNQVNVGLGEYFAFEGLKFKVNSYTFAYVPKGGGQPYIQNVDGSKITPEIRNTLHHVKSGDMIVITNVNVTGPTGTMTINGKNMTVK